MRWKDKTTMNEFFARSLFKERKSALR